MLQSKITPHWPINNVYLKNVGNATQKANHKICTLQTADDQLVYFSPKPQMDCIAIYTGITASK